MIATSGGARRHGAAFTEPPAVRAALTALVLLFLGLFLVLPLATVFLTAFAKGAGAFASAIRDPDAFAALRLTLLTAVIVVPLNLVFGLAAAWAIAKFTFRGKSVVATLIDLPFAISPVIAGLVFVLVFGRNGVLGAWFLDRGIHVLFAVPGIVLATLFVSLPFVAREITPVLQAAGNDEEEAAMVLGANGVQTFLRVTLPNVKWGVLYGVILCNARVMGEFGAVSVVSGHVRGLTNTLPLQVEILYNEYNMQAAFAVASLLTLLAVVTLVLKTVAERRLQKEAGR